MARRTNGAERIPDSGVENSVHRGNAAPGTNARCIERLSADSRVAGTEFVSSLRNFSLNQVDVLGLVRKREYIVARGCDRNRCQSVCLKRCDYRRMTPRLFWMP
jgi:hypothetical protein